MIPYQYIAGPLIGAVIGYFTNYIAVKMLFLPKHEIRVFGKRLPFTPGAIPKGKDRLSKAIGEVVGSTLITKEAITDKLLEEQSSRVILDAVMQKLEEPLSEELMQLTDASGESYRARRDGLSQRVSEMLAGALSQMDITDMAADKCIAVIREKVKVPMFSLIMPDEKLRTYIEEAAAELQTEIGANGASYIRPALDKKLDELEGSSGTALFETLEIDREKLYSFLNAGYRKLVVTGVEKLLAAVDISGIVRGKIDEMSIDELEALVLQVMKKELNTIVSLGALIGFLIGILNIFV